MKFSLEQLRKSRLYADPANRQLIERAAHSCGSTTSKTSGSLPAAEQEPNPCHEPLGTAPRTHSDPMRCLVRVTSFRCRLLDERNLWDHYIIDSLVMAGILFDDSPEWAKIEVAQEKVGSWRDERIEVEILLSPNPLPH